MRNSKGQFAPGNTFGKGRPNGSGKKHIKELMWGNMNRVAMALFGMTDAEFAQWFKDNQGEMTRAEKVFLKTLMKDSNTSFAHLKDFIDKYVGKTGFAPPDDDRDEGDPLDEALAILEAEELGIPVEEFMAQEEARSTDSEEKEEAPEPPPNDFMERKLTKNDRGAIEHKKKQKEKRRQKRKLGRVKRNGKRRR